MKDRDELVKRIEDLSKELDSLKEELKIYDEAMNCPDVLPFSKDATYYYIDVCGDMQMLTGNKFTSYKEFETFKPNINHSIYPDSNYIHIVEHMISEVRNGMWYKWNFCGEDHPSYKFEYEKYTVAYNISDDCWFAFRQQYYMPGAVYFPTMELADQYANYLNIKEGVTKYE